MIALLKYLDGDWEKVRGYLREDLDHIEAAINQRWGVVFGDDNTLKSGAVTVNVLNEIGVISQAQIATRVSLRC